LHRQHRLRPTAVNCGQQRSTASLYLRVALYLWGTLKRGCEIDRVWWENGYIKGG
jgi:hypothetical protein